MKRVFKAAALVLLLAVTSQSFVSCIGSYGLFKTVTRWNKGMNKWVGTGIHILFYIIPVYEVCLLADIFVFNTIEFWLGSNPFAMAPGEKRIKLVTRGEDTYQLTATQNRMDIKALSGKNKGKTESIIFNPKNHSWYLMAGGKSYKVMKMDPANRESVKVFYPDGKTEMVNVNKFAQAM